jgi:DNA polymerase III subunit delta'
MDKANWGLVGHEWAVAALQRAIAGGRVPHALLFVGQPGVGKRTLARTLARALQCTASDVASRPCGACRSCVQIAAGNYPDVRVIETERAAGTTRTDRRDITIDQIRTLQHQLSLKPYEGAWVIGIIADAHEMSDAAANCLLKTLEEPPPHVVLILTAPDPSLLLPTILSRCQVMPLHPLPFAEAESSLVEKFAMAPDQASILAHLSGGRIGWALRAVADESVLAGRRERVDMLVRLIGASRGQRLEQAAALGEDYGKGVDAREGVHETLDLWATWWRDVLLVQEGCAGQVTNADRLDAVRAAAARYQPREVARVLADVIAARHHLDKNVNPRLALDVALLSLPHA